jgi:hypothetical protein
LRPNKSSTFKTLLQQAQAVAIEPEHLDQITALAAKDEDVARVTGDN